MAEPQRRFLAGDTGADATADGSALDGVMPHIPEVHLLTDEEAHAIFDKEARQVMGMSGEQFLRRYDAGEFKDMPDDINHLDYWDLVISIPFGR